MERASKFDRLKKVEGKKMGLGKHVNCVDVITPFSLSFSLTETRNTRPSFGVPGPLAVCIGLGGMGNGPTLRERANL